MGKQKRSIREFLENPSSFIEDSYNFHDYFCDFKALERKFKNLTSKVKFLVKMDVLDIDNSYVWFKNNKPAWGRQYDTFGISDINTEELLVLFTPNRIQDVYENQCFIDYKQNGFDYEDVFENWTDFKNSLKTDDDLKNLLKKLLIKKYVIEDWAGNSLFTEKEFETYEDGWEFVHENVKEEYEGDGTYDDYYVMGYYIH